MHGILHEILPGDISPPSAPDLYQLILAAAKGHHNCGYIVATEGVYAYYGTPTCVSDIMRDLSVYLQKHDIAFDQTVSRKRPPAAAAWGRPVKSRARPSPGP